MYVLLFLQKKAVIVPFTYNGAGEITVKLFFILSHLSVEHFSLHYHCFSVSGSLGSLFIA